jgi:hypothetical protein
MKEFEVVYEAFDYWFTKQIQRKYDYIRAPDITAAAEIAAFKLGLVDIISIEEFV